jgi:FkbM family methyltransferase
VRHRLVGDGQKAGAVNAGVERVINGDTVSLCPEFAYAEPLRAQWEPSLYARFKEALRPGMTVLDVGASFGLYSMAAARTIGPSGRVYAFEPARRTVSALRLHLHWNGVADRVELIEAAAADRTGSAVFWEQDTSFVASLVEAATRQEERRYRAPIEGRRVRTVALDDFCSGRGIEPDVVKVDVEGSEASVLRGAREVLRRRHALLFLEIHCGFPAGAGGSAEAVFAELGAEAATRHYACSPARRG